MDVDVMCTFNMQMHHSLKCALISMRMRILPFGQCSSDAMVDFMTGCGANNTLEMYVWDSGIRPLASSLAEGHIRRLYIIHRME